MLNSLKKVTLFVAVCGGKIVQMSLMSQLIAAKTVDENQLFFQF